MSTCFNCEDYDERIEHLDSFIAFQSVRAGKSLYKNPPFTHCPWCGSELVPSGLKIGIEENAKGLERPLNLDEL